MLARSISSFSLLAVLLCCAALWGQNADPRLAPVDVSVQAIADIPPQPPPANSTKRLVTSTWGPQSIRAAATREQGSSTYVSGKQMNLSTRPANADALPNTSATGLATNVARESVSGGTSAPSKKRTQLRNKVQPTIIDPQTDSVNPGSDENTEEKLHKWEPRSFQQRAGVSRSVDRYHRQRSPSRSEPCRTQILSTQAPCSTTSSKAQLSAADRLRQRVSMTDHR